MLIVSWNVAGLSTTVKRIHEFYGSNTNTTASSSTDANTAEPSSQQQQQQQPLPSDALRRFFERHHGDIFCLQEHKIPKQQLLNRSEPKQASTVYGYESFWSCCTDETKKGLNGVVTYARQGTVIRANAAPLGVPELDQQGRCVMTDHGSFVLFNVYVPASGGQPLSFKMKFLNALRRAMQHERQVQGKAVILVGDLNISHTEKDIYWKDRTVHISEVLQQVSSFESNSNDVAEGGQADEGTLPQWKRDVAQHWATIEAVMDQKQVLPSKTKNSLTHQEYEKFRLAVTVKDRRVFLGKHETSPDHCLHCYEFGELYYEDEETGEQVLAQEGNAVRLQVLAELMLKIAGVKWEEETLRLIAETDATIQRASPTRKWLTSVLQDDNMVDTFRHFYPNAQARFTCWHQFTNCRYINDGSRIDFTLVDQSLLHRVQKGNVNSLRCCGTPEEEHLTEAAALAAATANGRFQPVSFQGGGIHEATMDALNTQFGQPHTGMIYTPPAFSDHIAISLLLDDYNDDEAAVRGNLILDEKDASTRKAQPHKMQKTIASFFGSSASATASTSSSAGASTKIKERALASSSSGGGGGGGSSSSSSSSRSSSTNNEETSTKRPKLSNNTGKGGGGAETKKVPSNSILNQLSALPRTNQNTNSKNDSRAASSNSSNKSGGGGGGSASTSNTNKRPSSLSSKKSGKGAAAAPAKKVPANSILNHFQRRQKDAP